MVARASFETIFRKRSEADALAAVRLVKDVRARDRRGWTLLATAAYYGHVDACLHLLDAGADIEDGERAPLLAALWGLSAHDALSSWRVRAALSLLERGADPNVADDLGRTPLHHALAVGQAFPDLVACLLSRGADIEARTVTGLLPLHAACGAGDAGSVKLLLERGAQLDEVNEGGRGVLAFAVDALSFGDREAVADKVELVLWLLEAGASREAYERTERPLLVAAAWCRSSPLVEDCIARGAEVDAADETGTTALLAAATLGDAEIVERLLRAGADPRRRDAQGKSAATRAERSPEVLQLLAQAGAPPDPVVELDTHGRTRLMRACLARRIDDVRQALDAHANVNAKDRQGKTALTHLLDDTFYSQEARAIFDLLVAQDGIDVRVPTRTGMTALHFAARQSGADRDIVGKLLELGADPRATAKNGTTPRSVVKPYDQALRELLAREP